jgi:AraC-like DNA-binding protein
LKIKDMKYSFIDGGTKAQLDFFLEEPAIIQNYINKGEIAYELGFEEQAHFSRFFKNRTNQSPQIIKRTIQDFAKCGKYNN